jgi:hypothetical protein
VFNFAFVVNFKAPNSLMEGGMRGQEGLPVLHSFFLKGPPQIVIPGSAFERTDSIWAAG